MQDYKELTIKKIAQFRFNVEIAFEFRYSDSIIDSKNVVIFVSQSGEALDTLMALRLVKSKGAKTIAITNVLGSNISREADVVIYTLAGPEISVASTKSYTAQVMSFYLLSLEIALKLKKITEDEYKNYILKAYNLSGKIKEIFDSKEKIKRIAETIKNRRNSFYIGRGIDEKVAREGSLKMKEITYIHTEAFPVGELKQGTIALIEKDTMVVVVVTQKDMVEKVVSNIK